MVLAMTRVEDQFRDAISQAGLTPPDHIVADGKIRRFATNGRRDDDSGWYVMHDDGIAAGSFGDWRSGLSQNWRATIDRSLTPVEVAALREKAEADKVQRDEAEKARHAEAARNAKRLVQNATGDVSTHPYLVKKNC